MMKWHFRPSANETVVHTDTIYILVVSEKLKFSLVPFVELIQPGTQSYKLDSKLYKF